MDFGLPARYNRDVVAIEARLTPEQARDLRARADEEGVDVAALLRRGVDLVLRTPPLGDDEQRRHLDI